VKEDLKNLREFTISSLNKAQTEREVNEIRVKVLGRKGTLTGILKSIPSLAPEERREVGKIAN